jgi:hypothetical protein
MFLGDHVELIIRESSLELLDFWDSTGTKRNTRYRLVELMSKGCLHSSSMINNNLVLWVSVQFCFGHYNRTGTTKFIFVLDLNDTILFSEETFQVHNITLTTGTTMRHFHMDHVDVDRVVQGKLVIGQQPGNVLGSDDLVVGKARKWVDPTDAS